MKGDFTRSTFRPHRHYSGVRMQQGRVQLDADWNENLDILMHRIETETLDVIGECGVPVHNAAFGVVTNISDLSAEEQDWLQEQGFDSLAPGDFYLTRGRAYVDGILVENDLTLPFSQQPFVLPKGGGQIEEEGIHLLYLDVWHRHITALEDAYIREVALGGPDTATRTQVIWQARLAQVGKVGEGITCSDDFSPWPGPSAGRLSARTHPESQPEDPCTIPPGAGYKRLENQLYRVEIHEVDAATGAATFKWSRDNGSVVVAISEFDVDGANTKIRTTSLGRDDVLGLHLNDWVEILDDAAELAGMPGTLAQITDIDPDNILTLSTAISGYDIEGHPKVRRWDSDGALPVSVPATNDGYLQLEGGVEVKFVIDTFQTGDYWLIPARTLPGQYGDIEWPLDEGGDPAALLPFGIIHHYCKLAVITAEVVEGAISITDVDDCRKKFPPLTELPTGGNCCCSVSVGEGGDYPDIQSALDARPQDVDEWRICVNAGEHKLNETVTGKEVRGVVISGCGRQTHVIAPADKPAFAFYESEEIQIDNLWVDAASPDAAILFDHSDSVVVSNCFVSNQIISKGDLVGAAGDYASVPGRFKNRFGQPGPAIVVKSGKQVEIYDNDIFGFPAILAGGANLFIQRNRMTGGGVQIIAPSQLVEIDENLIMKGVGPGIQLGGGADDFKDYERTFDAKAGATVSYSRSPLAGIRKVMITHNLIGGMTGSGIVTELSLDSLSILGDVEEMVITDNQIISCCAEPDVILTDNARVGGGIAMIGIFSTLISQNFIAGNGSRQSPACGVFVLDGSDIEISGNAIFENGAEENNPEPEAYQAGIAAQFVLGNFLSLGQGFEGKLGYPALRVCDNQVICPAGQALSVVAIGSVIVDGNTLASRERLDQPVRPLKFGKKGACVSILNLGLPIWLPELALMLQMLGSGHSNLHMDNAELEMKETTSPRFPDGRVLFNNNQVTFNTERQEPVESLGEFDSQWFVRAWDAASFSVLMISLDDISISGNQFQASVPQYMLEGLEQYRDEKISTSDLFAYMLKFIHVGSVAITIRATGNGLSERLFSNWVSYASAAVAMNVTTSNEATHTFVTVATKKIEDNLSLSS